MTPTPEVPIKAPPSNEHENVEHLSQHTLPFDGQPRFVSASLSNAAPGYFPVELGIHLAGTGTMYTILRKLGECSDSSVWMAQTSRGKLVAIKIITRLSSIGILNGTRLEHKFLLQLTESNGVHSHCSVPIDVISAESAYGTHMCFVFPLHGSCLEELWIGLHEQNLQFPVVVVKSFIRQTLIALAHIHSLDLIHTDVNLSNLLICMDGQREDVADYIREHPTEQYQPLVDERLARSSGPIASTTFRSQSLPPLGVSLRTMRICLSDFGEARQLITSGGRCSTIPAMRAPEIILEHPWGRPIDVWAVGCIAFELLSNTRIFDIKAPVGMNPTHVHLARIVELLGTFPASMRISSKSAEFFDDDGCLRTSLPTAFKQRETLQERLSAGGLSDTEVQQAARFILRCLSIDPQSRASAAELLEDVWFEDACSPLGHHSSSSPLAESQEA